MYDKTFLIKEKATEWFHSKLGVSKEAYLECMNAYLGKETEYGWEFFFMVQGDGEEEMTRMYIYR
ncbi:MAG TPA: hypothetical protein DCQ87_06295 [Lachnospiraceae bacterium]|nr:hypothetical protein [Lachnospiraceae bacterium]